MRMGPGGGNASSGTTGEVCHDARVPQRIDPEGAETDALARVAALDGLRVLELGCGDGRLTFRYADATASVLAVDPDPHQIAAARAAVPLHLADRVSFAAVGAAEVDAPRRSFDLALFAWSL
jgi:predicted RNA methylase